MATFNEQLQDKLWLHSLYVQRYAARLGRLGNDRILTTEREIRALITEYVARMDGVPITTKRGQQLLKEFERKLIELRRKAWVELTAELEKEAKQFAKVDHAAQIKVVDDIMPLAIGMHALDVASITAIATVQPFEGNTLRGWMTLAQQRDINRLLRVARIGMVNGETIEQMVARVIGSQKYQYKDGMSRKFRSDIEANLITCINGISNNVWANLAAANDDIIDYEVFQATLDGRTTIQCASNDNKKFKVGEGPIPPLHMRCRSKRLPVVTDAAFNRRGMDPTFEKELVQEFARKNQLGQVNKVGDLPYGYKTAYNKWMRHRRRELVGDAPADLRFEDWLRKRSTAFQDEYLGKRKAELFRQNKLSLDKFVTRDGYELTIDQLEKLVS
ncbi:minor head protein-like protein [Vibrio phage vB_VpaS_AL-2]|uniref:Phage head morphogenesis domain-containing protein n=1 Tax=Vibrio phage PH669 TaxID=2800823 RepID=A0A7T7CL39_9CAUD|nr:minor head protein-like protein [Vibrio phage VspDsh_1]QEQ95128.1 minor head protein-like protein [Vibrio phage vB_VpS_BA3]QQK88519.1 hypothetical protein [Vibrio phage PH669]UFK26984.1 minor head protein-like protein [Vibrio phage vB_VpaS_AL-2]